MSSTGVTAFDKTIDKTTAWLDELATLLGLAQREQAYKALRAVLHAVRDRLPPAEASDLGAQLPMLVRGFYYDGWHPADKPLKYRDEQHFIEYVARELPGLDKAELEITVTAVFDLLGMRLGNATDKGETGQVRRALPVAVRALWPQPGL
jgi:uncharacterized protein (DUF2267 family)